MQIGKPTIYKSFQLIEPRVRVRCRQCDVDIIEKIIPDCESTYKSNTKSDVTLIIDNSSHLPADCLGGIDLFTENRKILLSNTLDTRIDRLFYLYLPVISGYLFETTTEVFNGAQ